MSIEPGHTGSTGGALTDFLFLRQSGPGSCVVLSLRYTYPSLSLLVRLVVWINRSTETQQQHGQRHDLLRGDLQGELQLCHGRSQRPQVRIVKIKLFSCFTKKGFSSSNLSSILYQAVLGKNSDRHRIYGGKDRACAKKNVVEGTCG